jgi:hypothetical protein
MKVLIIASAKSALPASFGHQKIPQLPNRATSFQPLMFVNNQDPL